MSRIALVAALSGELKPLVRGWRRERRGAVDLWRRTEGRDERIAACAGAGAAAAARAFREIERGGPLDLVYSIGWAGALTGACLPGRAYEVSEVVDAATGERFRTGSATGFRLATHVRVAGPGEKRGLAARLGADLVDMEAAGVARLAAERSVAFRCLKGVSDAASDKLPDFNAYLAPDGRFQTVRFALSALARPWSWSSLWRLGRSSSAASLDLARLLRRDLG